MSNAKRGCVYFIGAGPGDPDLITVRGRALIERCEVCLFAGSLVPRAVVAYAPKSATVRSTASMDLDQIIALLDAATAAGHDVARVHSGDPSLFGAIAEQMRRLDALGISYEIVPGVSAFQAAAAALGIELTPAGKNQALILARAAGQTARAGHEDLAALAQHRTGMCLFLSAGLMPEVTRALEPAYGAQAPVVVAHRVSWPDQQLLHTTVGEASGCIDEAGITRTALILVGPMLESGPAADSRLYDKAHAHLFRRAKPKSS